MICFAVWFDFMFIFVNCFWKHNLYSQCFLKNKVSQKKKKCTVATDFLWGSPSYSFLLMWIPWVLGCLLGSLYWSVFVLRFTILCEKPCHGLNSFLGLKSYLVYNCTVCHINLFNFPLFNMKQAIAISVGMWHWHIVLFECVYVFSLNTIIDAFCLVHSDASIFFSSFIKLVIYLKSIDNPLCFSNTISFAFEQNYL